MKHIKNIKTLITITLGAITLIIPACKKADKQANGAVIPLGTYSGKLYTNAYSSIYNKVMYNSTVVFTSSNYSSQNVNINPAANSVLVTSFGNYQFKGDSILFAATAITPISNQPLQASLTGNYQYYFAGDTLILTQTDNLFTTTSQYRLKKN